MRPVGRAALVLAVSLLFARTSFAQTDYAWSGVSFGNWGLASSWTPAGGPPTIIDNALLGGSGAYTAALTDDRGINNLTLNNASATLQQTNASVLTVNGTISLTAGTYAMQGGIISGGSISSSGGSLLVNTNSANELRNVSIGNGVLSFGSGGRVLLTSGTNFAPGTNLNMPANAIMVVRQTTTLDQMTITMVGTSTSSTSMLALEGAGNVLTFGSGFTLRSTAASPHNEFDTGEYITGAVTLQNRGLIENAGTGTLSIAYRVDSPLTFLNQSGGVLRATAGTLEIGGQSVTNESGGIIEAAGGTAWIVGNWSNSGIFRISSGTLRLGGTFTTAGIGTLERSGGNVEVSGALNNAGSTLALTASTGSFTLLGGSVTGGSITSDGIGRFRMGLHSSNRLTDVAIGVGVLEFPDFGSQVLLNGSTTLASGSAVTLSGVQSHLGIARTATFSGLNLEMAGSQSMISVEGANTLTLAPDTTVFTNPGSAQEVHLASHWFTDRSGGTGAIVNQGTIRADSGVLVVSPDTFTNSGTLLASSGTVRVRALTQNGSQTINFTNLNSGTLTGGSYLARNGGTLDFDGRSVTALGAGTIVELNGARSSFPALSTLDTNGGTLRILGGQNFAGASSILNTGLVMIGSGSTLTGNLNVLAGTVRGSGTVTGNLIYGNAGGTLAPGDETSGSTGIFSATSVRLSAATTFDVDLNGTTAGSGHDQLAISGVIDLNNATLAASLGSSFSPQEDDVLTIVQNNGGSAVTGQFAGLPQGTAFMIGATTAYINYFGGNGNDVVIQFAPVPEPGTLLLITGLALAAGRAGRRRAFRRSN